ncbi:MAG TPA: class I SAM-dependent methyltransferase [Candidatus Binatia bacterium]|nr:class I SAM-dependent methyltransferase [Candidatus Binatia bacterium]
MIDPHSFREFEHTGWQSIPTRYHEAFGSLTTQAIGPLLDAVGTRGGVKLIDIASGPGYVAAAAARRGATVVGIDFSAAMVAEAQRRYPGVEFREGDAEELPFGNGLFDAAVMNFGILHLARPDHALVEAHRVLRSGGRFGFTVWAKPEETVGFGIILRALEIYGELTVRLPEGPPFFRFSEPSECVRSLVVAGFESPKVSKIPQVWRLASVDYLFEFMKEGTVRTAGLLRSQKPEALDQIRHSIREQLEAYQKADAVELPMPAILVTARKA